MITKKRPYFSRTSSVVSESHDSIPTMIPAAGATEDPRRTEKLFAPREEAALSEGATPPHSATRANSNLLQSSRSARQRNPFE